MKARFFTALVATLFTLPALAADLSGTWSGSLTDPQGGKHDVTLNLKVDGDKVSGTFAGGPPDGSAQNIENGKLNGDQLSFDLKMQGPGGEAMVASCKAKVSGNEMKGTHDTPMGSLSWEATKK